MDAKAFGELLRQYRTAAGFSQEHLAELAHLSAESIGALERGIRRAPYRETVALISKALRLDDIARAELEAAAQRGRARGTRGEDADRERPSTRNLPLQSTSFVGREQDIATVVALLNENRLVTITGSGGVGKTRAVIEVAARLPEDRWPNIRFVDLSQLTESTLVARGIGAAFLPGLAEPGSAEALVAALRSSKLLFVVDNCEHLVAAIAPVVSAVLRSCPNVSFLATSRERLAVIGEAVYRLPSLGVPAHTPPRIAQARQYASVELFIQRATAVDGRLEFTDASAGTIVEICRRLDGIPLAIELAAARVPAFGLGTLAERLRNDFSFTGVARNLPDRQQTMFATIAWSYNLLDPAERSILQRLSLFVGGFTLAAAETVCADDALAMSGIAGHLSSLVDKSLVNVTLSEHRARYTLLDSVRSFALDRLKEAGLVASLAQRHASWVADFADFVEATRIGKPDVWLRLEADPELENARAALVWAMESKTAENVVLAGRIVGGLRTIWLTSMRRTEGKKWAEAALAAIDQEAHPRVAASLLRTLIQATPGPESLAWSERAAPVFELIGDHIGLALLHSHASSQYRNIGDLVSADAAITRSTKIFARDGMPRLMPYAVFIENRAYLRIEQGRYAEADADIIEGAALMRTLGDEHAPRFVAARANLAHATGDYATAVRITEEWLKRTPANSVDRAFLSDAHSALAVFRVAHGDADGALAAARAAIVRTQFGEDFDEIRAFTLQAVALVAASRSKERAAARLFGLSRANPNLSDGYIERSCRDLLVAALESKLSRTEIDLLMAEGAAATSDWVIAQALEI